MKEKKSTTEDFRQEEQIYQTGSVTPPKNYGGIIAFLLVLVIFLCGISTALGLMNIRLFRQLSAADAQDENCAVAFSDAATLDSDLADDALVHFSIGFTGQGIPAFWQHYHDLPQGIYITEVQSASAAEESGILPGDVLISLDGIPVPNSETLQSILDTFLSGEALEAVICRSGSELKLTVTID
ncbi:MAG: PDZ domain-containing protein [Oscillospiraceae bacterium]|nr:PDZ domain-containing protein [Oscillospiraceae bacterium]